jgi:hypothetical protein
MQLRDKPAKEVSVGGFDAGSDLGDEFFTNRAFIIAHRHARKERLAFARGNRGGLIVLIRHETHPRAAFDRIPASP